MKFFSALLLITIIVLSAGCNNSQEEQKTEAVDLSIDQEATAETVALYNNLKEVAKTHVLYGHQDDLAYGYSWWAEEGRSDVKEVTGSYPAVYGWELGNLRQDTDVNLDGVSFEKMKGWIQEGYERGGVITIAWHMNHPVTDGDSWDRTPAVSAILPGGEEHEKFNNWLDKFAVYVTDLRGKDGELIPVIFRPYHEHTGSWFWWGDEQTTVEEYVALWRYTVEYLRNEKQVHNLLWAYSPDGQSGRALSKYFEKYPGDDYVDILGLDDYGSLNDRDPGEFSDDLAWLVEEAKKRDKIPALTETGVETIPNENWWTEQVLVALESNPKAKGIAYVLTWRNANYEREQREHFYASHPEHPSAPDMKAFRDTELVMFEDELPDLYTLD
ncbi:glycoside hydrolase family 26 protein [Gracilimonas mengyeensis]|uniref:Mannan endo-1,4-beta-mannosidase n=1 Tax=Gracilimonas mengyeensis TaxID=1302730 RepID=A0A521AHU9_9BACT|nr:glycosyl hydrolase [Gracilimonas mengyeensis]SMO34270.1 mannan endo-1,4-beta-mannosidase [Gracilimonas mengyeensis]